MTDKKTFADLSVKESELVRCMEGRGQMTSKEIAAAFQNFGWDVPASSWLSRALQKLTREGYLDHSYGKYKAKEKRDKAGSRNTVATAILEILSSGKEMSPAEIGRAVRTRGITPKRYAVNSALQYLKKTGRAANSGFGRWRKAS